MSLSSNLDIVVLTDMWLDEEGKTFFYRKFTSAIIKKKIVTNLSYSKLNNTTLSITYFNSVNAEQLLLVISLTNIFKP